MLRTGDEIGPYTLVDKIGKGAFGVVWLAERRTSITTTKVAIKIPANEDIDLDLIKQEANLWVLASGHPNILPIIEANIYEDMIVIVSEYLSEGTLADRLKKIGSMPLTLDRSIELTCGILSGLKYLHGKNILHRDLKPENILLQGDMPRLADFGISRVFRSTSQHSSIAAGTPPYMSPEAFYGKRDIQNDLWAVAVIFYRLITGRLPFPQNDFGSLIKAILDVQPQPLPAHLPAEIVNFFQRAFDKDVQQRFANAAEMQQALKQYNKAKNEHSRSYSYAFTQNNACNSGSVVFKNSLWQSVDAERTSASLICPDDINSSTFQDGSTFAVSPLLAVAKSVNRQSLKASNDIAKLTCDNRLRSRETSKIVAKQRAQNQLDKRIDEDNYTGEFVSEKINKAGDLVISDEVDNSVPVTERMPKIDNLPNANWHWRGRYINFLECAILAFMAIGFITYGVTANPNFTATINKFLTSNLLSGKRLPVVNAQTDQAVFNNDLSAENSSIQMPIYPKNCRSNEVNILLPAEKSNKKVGDELDKNLHRNHGTGSVIARTIK